MVTSWIGLHVKAERESAFVLCQASFRARPNRGLAGAHPCRAPHDRETERKEQKERGEKEQRDTGGLPDALHHVPKFNPGSSSHCIHSEYRVLWVTLLS